MSPKPMKPSRSGSDAKQSKKRGKSHPRKPCRYGTQCRRSECTFAHPDGRETQDKKPGNEQAIRAARVKGLEYYTKKGEWLPTEPRTIAEEDAAKTIKLVTLNMWMEEFALPERTAEQIATFRNLDASVICLQEVTRPALALLTSDAWIRENFILSDVDCSTFPKEAYGVIIMVRKTVFAFAKFLSVLLPTSMARTLILGHLYTDSVAQGAISVGTVHLESLYSPDVREKQLSLIRTAMSSRKDFVLCGDFNFCYKGQYKRENENMLRTFDTCHDVWAQLHDDDPGYTFDTIQNPMLKSMGRRRKKCRFDRILLGEGTWKADSIERFGTEPFTEDGIPVTLSDHFGLVTCLTRKD